jgi:hypothetical protein
MRTALAAVAAALLAATASAAVGGPRVALVHPAPVTFAGSGYRANAHIVVAYRSGSTVARRTVVASVRGSFRLALPGISFRRCDGASVSAGAASLRVASCAAGGRPRLTADPGGAVSGLSFVPGERVVVVARPSGGQAATRTVAASPRGTFEVRVGTSSSACAEITYRAIGSLGSTATFVASAPDCMAP